MKGLRIVIVSCVALAATFSLSACGADTKTRATAFCVRSTQVREESLSHWDSVFAAMNSAAARSLADGDSASARARNFLTAVARSTGEASELGVKVTDAAARAALQLLRYEEVYGSSSSARKAVPKAALDARGENSSDRLTVVRMSILAERLEDRFRHDAEQSLSYARLARFFREHKHDFLIPERRDAAIIISFKKSRIELAKRELDAGRRFLDVMRRRNEEPVAGGIHRNLRRGHAPRLYEEKFFTARPHVAVGPLKAEIYYLFEVIAVKKPRQQSLAEVETVIRRRLIDGTAHGLLASTARTIEARWPMHRDCSTASS
jgi:hypothetical protein